MYRIKYKGEHSINICLSNHWSMSVEGRIGWEVKRDIVTVWVEWNAPLEDSDVAAIDAVKNSGRWVTVDISFEDATGAVHEWETLFIYSFIVDSSVYADCPFVENSAYASCRLECYTQEYEIKDYIQGDDD